MILNVSHVATYAPFCDAIVLDQPMAELVNNPRVGLTRDYGTKVFSLNNWDGLFAWIDDVENEITPEHEQALEAAYPC